MEIRPETTNDQASVHEVITAAFESQLEADLVDALRLQAESCISLVAEDGDEIVGHIMFSPATLSADPDICVMGLGPMAVKPERQRQGIGNELLQAGLEQCKKLGCRAVFVLGHSQYYPRFGFVPAVRFAISSAFDVPDDVFMALELEPGALAGKAGKMHYHQAFADL